MPRFDEETRKAINAYHREWRQRNPEKQKENNWKTACRARAAIIVAKRYPEEFQAEIEHQRQIFPR